jgi:hypothetical protein
MGGSVNGCPIDPFPLDRDPRVAPTSWILRRKG